MSCASVESLKSGLIKIIYSLSVLFACLASEVLRLKYFANQMIERSLQNVLTRMAASENSVK